MIKNKKSYLAFTWPTGDSDADDAVVEQQQSSALCSRHLHRNTHTLRTFHTEKSDTLLREECQKSEKSVKNLPGKLGATVLLGTSESVKNLARKLCNWGPPSQVTRPTCGSELGNLIRLGPTHLASTVELEPLDIVLSEQHPRSLALPDLPSHRSQLLVERRRLLALSLSLVQHLGEGLQGSEGQLEGHSVSVARRRLLQEVLQEKDELGEPLDRFHHQTKEVQPVVGSDLLHLGAKVF